MNTNRLYFSEKGDLSYDCVGNLVTDEDEYDYENRITKITMDVNDIAQFAYDALGRRIRKTDSKDANNTKLYYYNNNWQVLYEASDSGSVTKSLLYGNYIDEVIFMRQNLAPRWFVHDHLYSPVALTNTSGTVLERYEYDAYGHCTFLEPNFTPLQTQKSQYANNYAFQGKRLDLLDDGGLQFMSWLYRNYLPPLGRWTQADKLGIIPNDNGEINPYDPIGQYKDGLNLYEALGSNPVVTLDSYGLIPWPFSLWCKPRNPKNLSGAYDWWDPSTPEGVKCEKPCKWRNTGAVKSDISSGGCYTTNVTLPLGPGCGGGLAIAGILFEVSGPSVSLCNGHIVEKFRCQCKVVIWRRCKTKCCDCEHGVWTDKKKIRATLIGYGEGVRRWGFRSPICSCDPRLWLGVRSFGEIVDEDFTCK